MVWSEEISLSCCSVCYLLLLLVFSVCHITILQPDPTLPCHNESHPKILNRHLINNFSTIFMTLYVLIPSTFSLSILPKLKKKNSYYEITCIITIIQGCSNNVFEICKIFTHDGSICSIVFNLLHTLFLYTIFILPFIYYSFAEIQ